MGELAGQVLGYTDIDNLGIEAWSWLAICCWRATRGYDVQAGRARRSTGRPGAL